MSSPEIVPFTDEHLDGAAELLAARPGLPRPAPMTEFGDRLRFFEGLARAVLAAPPPLLLLVDDLQWCDGETIEWLHFLSRFDPEARLLVLGTARSEKLDPAQVEKDNQCVLGKWIHGAGGGQYHGSPMVTELTETHAAFHRCVAEIVRKADRGEIIEATDSLHNGEYSKLSYRIKTQLARLCLAAGKAQASG